MAEEWVEDLQLLGKENDEMWRRYGEYAVMANKWPFLTYDRSLLIYDRSLLIYRVAQTSRVPCIVELFRQKCPLPARLFWVQKK
jgi:hypothetical protein